MDPTVQTGIVLTWPILAGAAAAIGTAVGAAARWIFDRFDKQLERVDRMQQAYLRDLEERDKREEERRKQHLEDIKFAKEQLYEVALKLRPDSRRPPPEVKP